jgi:hypothetical protein
MNAEPAPAEMSFIAMLTQQWVTAGGPSTEEMARRAGVPSDGFPSLADSQTEPLKWADAELLLRGCGVLVANMQWWRAQHNARRGTEIKSLPGQDRVPMARSPRTKRSTARRPDDTPDPDDTPRREPPLSDCVQPVKNARSVEDFLSCLKELRGWAGVSFGDIARDSGGTISKSTAHGILTRNKLPTREQAKAFVSGCNVSSAELEIWLDAWNRLAEHRPRPQPPRFLEHANDRVQATTTVGAGVRASSSRGPAAPHSSPAPSPPAMTTSRPGPKLAIAMLRSFCFVLYYLSIYSGAAIAMTMAHVDLVLILMVFGCTTMILVAVIYAQGQRAREVEHPVPSYLLTETPFDDERLTVPPVIGG